MTDGPTPPVTPPVTPPPKAPSAQGPRAKRPGVRNADVPSDTLGLPGVGEGASATHFARDLTREQQAEGDEEPDSRAPADPRDGAG